MPLYNWYISSLVLILGLFGPNLPITDEGQELLKKILKKLILYCSR